MPTVQVLICSRPLDTWTPKKPKLCERRPRGFSFVNQLPFTDVYRIKMLNISWIDCLPVLLLRLMGFDFGTSRVGILRSLTLALKFGKFLSWVHVYVFDDIPTPLEEKCSRLTMNQPLPAAYRPAKWLYTRNNTDNGDPLGLRVAYLYRNPVAVSYRPWQQN